MTVLLNSEMVAERSDYLSAVMFEVRVKIWHLGEVWLWAALEMVLIFEVVIFGVGA